MIEFEVYAFYAASKISSIVYWILLAVLVVGVVVILFSQKTRRTLKIARLMLVEWVVLIFCSAVIFREARVESAINLVPLSSYFCIAENSYLKEVAVINLLNICLFLPVGVLLRLGFNRISWKKAMATGLIVSVLIELSQFLFCKGLCEVDDVIHNTVGCFAGFWITDKIFLLKWMVLPYILFF